MSGIPAAAVDAKTFKQKLIFTEYSEGRKRNTRECKKRLNLWAEFVFSRQLLTSSLLSEVKQVQTFMQSGQ